MKNLSINNKPIWEISGFLSELECDLLVKDRKEKFYKADSHYPQYYRNNDRLVEDNETLTKELNERLSQLNLPFKGRLNTRLRFCRYQRGQEFSRHQDGVYYPNEREESRYTFLLYLNDNRDFEQGNSSFFRNKTSDEVIHRIQPQKGKLVIFDHTIWHSGDIVAEGEKFVLRSDIILPRNSEESHHDGYIWTVLKTDNFLFTGGRDQMIKVWNPDLQLIKQLKIHTSSIICIRKLNGQSYVSSSRDMTLKSWDLEGNVHNEASCDSMILELEIGENQIYTACADGCLRIYDYQLHELHAVKVTNGWLWGISIDPDETVYLAGDDGVLAQWNLNKGVRVLKRFKNGLYSIRYREGQKLYVGDQEGNLIQMDLFNGALTKHKIHKDIIRSIRIREQEVFTCSEDNSVRKMNLMTGYKEKLLEHDNFVQDIWVDTDLLYSVGFNGEIKTKQLYNARLHKTLSVHRALHSTRGV